MHRMVTARDTGSKVSTFRKHTNSYLSNFGTTITLRRSTTTEDSMGRMTVISTTTSTISADVQWVTKQDLQHLNMGEVAIGDGMLFVKYNADVELEDEFDYGSIRYRITSQIEGELVRGNVDYKGYLFQKNAQS